MNLLRPRRRCHLRRVPRRNPATRHNHHPPSRSPHQLRNPRHSLRRRRLSSGCQQSRRPRRYHILQRSIQIRALIKRPMKRHRQRRSRPHQLRGPRNIDTSMDMQQTQHNSIHPRCTRRFNRTLHLLKLRRRVNKIPATRPHHRENRRPNTRPRLTHQLRARRHSSHFERPAQFNPRCPSALRRNRTLHTLDRNLHHHSSVRHRLNPAQSEFRFSNFDFRSSVASLTSLL